MAFDLQAAMFKAFRASYIVSLLTAIFFFVITSVVKREMVLAVTASITDSIAISSFPEIHLLYSSLRWL